MSKDYNKTHSKTQKLTKAQIDMLVRIHNASVNQPSIADVIAAFNLPTSRQNIQQHAARRAKHDKA